MLQYKIILVAVLFILFDVITGIIKAWKNGSVNSTKMREGLINKIVEVAAILFGFMCEVTLPELGLGVGIEFGKIISIYIVLTEVCSIIENFGEISPSVGKIVSGVFEKLKSEVKDDGGTK